MAYTSTHLSLAAAEHLLELTSHNTRYLCLRSFCVLRLFQFITTTTITHTSHSSSSSNTPHRLTVTTTATTRPRRHIPPTTSTSSATSRRRPRPLATHLQPTTTSTSTRRPRPAPLARPFRHTTWWYRIIQVRQRTYNPVTTCTCACTVRRHVCCVIERVRALRRMCLLVPPSTPLARCSCSLNVIHAAYQDTLLSATAYALVRNTTI